MKIRVVLLLAFNFTVMPQLAVSAPINVELVVNGAAWG